MRRRISSLHNTQAASGVVWTPTLACLRCAVSTYGVRLHEMGARVPACLCLDLTLFTYLFMVRALSACERPLPINAVRPLQRSLGSGRRSHRHILTARKSNRSASETTRGTTEEHPRPGGDTQQPLPLADESGLQHEPSDAQEQPPLIGAQSAVAAAVAALRQGFGSRLQPELVAIALGEHASCGCDDARMRRSKCAVQSLPQLATSPPAMPSTAQQPCTAQPCPADLLPALPGPQSTWYRACWDCPAWPSSSS